MSDHDPMCLYYGEPNEGDCTMCGVIATVRAHERARFVEAWDRDGHQVRFNYAHHDLTPQGRIRKWLRTVEL